MYSDINLEDVNNALADFNLISSGCPTEETDDGFQIVSKKERKPKPAAIQKPSTSKPSHSRSETNNLSSKVNSYSDKHARNMNGREEISMVDHRTTSKPSQHKSMGQNTNKTIEKIPQKAISVSVPGKSLGWGDRPDARPFPPLNTPKKPLSIQLFMQILSDIEVSITSGDSIHSTTVDQSRGLENSGNACYQNAIIQTLISNHEFKRVLDRLVEATTSQNYALPDELGIFKELLHFIDELRPSPFKFLQIGPIDPNVPFQTTLKQFRSLRARQSVSSPMSSSASLSMASSLSSTASQEDAMEFLTFLLDQYHEVLSQYNISTVPEQTADSTEANDDIDADEWITATKGVNISRAVVNVKSKQEALSQHTSSLISRLFHGILRSEVTYVTKKSSSTTFQRFHFIPLDIETFESKNIGAQSLEKSLQKFFASESVDNGKIRKGVLIEQLPKILILQAKRFSFDYRINSPIKIEAELEYPMILNLPKNFLSISLQERLSSNGSEINCNYRLVSAVLHHGHKATSGHYTAISQDHNGQWLLFDDTRIDILRVTDVLNKKREVYLLMYMLNN